MMVNVWFLQVKRHTKYYTSTDYSPGQKRTEKKCAFVYRFLNYIDRSKHMLIILKGTIRNDGRVK